MQTPLTNFRTELRDRLLDIVWRQWTSLGVSGHGKSWSGSVIDPEALLLVSCTIARYDPRLFDSILDWLRINGRFINVQRIKRMLKEELFSGEPVLRAVAAATSTSVDEAKWKRMSHGAKRKRGSKESLYFLKGGGRFRLSKKQMTFSRSMVSCETAIEHALQPNPSDPNPSAIFSYA